MSSQAFANLANSEFNGNIVLNNPNSYIQFPDGSQQFYAGGGAGGDVFLNATNTYTNTSVNDFEDSEITCATQLNSDNSTFVANTEFVQTRVGTVGQLSNNNTGIGNGASDNATGSNNCAFGSGALSSGVSGDSNTAVGYSSLTTCTTCHDNCAFGTSSLQNTTTGSYNTGIGSQSLLSLTTGQSNTCVGSDSGSILVTGSFNTCIGNQSGLYLAGGQNNTLIGDATGPLTGDTTTYNYLTCIGADSIPVVTGGSNQIVLGSITGNETVYIPGGNIVLGNNQSTPTFTFTLQPTYTDLLFIGSDGAGVVGDILDLSYSTTTMSSKVFIIDSSNTTINGNVSIPSPHNLNVNDIQFVNQNGDPGYTTNAVIYLNTTAPATQQLRCEINGTLYYINLTAV